jgi:hypothetical protein
VSRKLAKRLVEPDFWTCPHGVRQRPKKVLTYGPEVAAVCADAGFAPDPQQELGLDLIFAITPDGAPDSFETCIICSRQNLKTGLLKQAVLGWTFVLDEPDIVWSSHEMSTTREAQDELAELIRSTPSLSRHMLPTKNEGIYTENGEERIELADGRKIWFKARTLTGGRGLARRKLILDEAFALRNRMMGSLIPIMLAKRHAQVIYASSPGQADSEVLFEVRDRGRAGRTPRMTYLEWSGKPLPSCEDPNCHHPKTGLKRGDPCAYNRLELVLHANPTAVNTDRITVQDLDDTRNALPPEEWIRECMGQWEEPAADGEEKLDVEQWGGMGQATTDPLKPLAFGVTVYPDRARAAIGVAGHREDDLVQVELVAEGRGVRWPLDWIATRIPIWNPCAVVLDGTALPLAPYFEELGIEVTTTTSGDRAQAAVGFFDDFNADRLRHPGERLLDRAIETSARRTRAAGGFFWDGPDSGPLNAVTLAHWGLAVHGAFVEPPAKPLPVRNARPSRTTSNRRHAKDLNTVGF